MNRKKKLLLNTVTGMAKQVVTVICGFILPRFMLLYYGSEINGLVSSISHFLSFISLLDLGVGSVIQANLYKPLADRDTYRISTIIVSSQRFFRRLAYIFLGYIVVLAIVLPNTVSAKQDFLFTASLVIIIAISIFAQFYFGMTNELLLCADQKSYITVSMQIGTVLLNTLCCIILMKAGASIHAVKLLTAVIYVLRPIGQSLYVKNNYQIDRHVVVKGEVIKQKWNGLSQHFASVVCENIDVVLLSLFSSLADVSVYSVYYMVTSGVTMIIMTASTGIESLFGNMIAKNENVVLGKVFSMVEWGIHTLVTVVFSTAAVLIVPFISVYTKGIADANYIAPAFGTMMVVAYAARCLRIPYFVVVKAAGHFKQTQNGAFISADLNIVLSIALIFKFGLLGIAFGTFVALFYHTCYFVWYLRSNILNRGAKQFVLYIFSDLLCFGVISAVTSGFRLADLTYADWIMMAIKTGLISIVVTGSISAIFYRNQLQAVFQFLKNRDGDRF